MSPCVAISAQRWETDAYRDQTRSVGGWAGFVRFGFTAWDGCFPGSNVKQVKESVPVMALDSIHCGRKSRPHKGFSDLTPFKITVPYLGLTRLDTVP